MSKIRAAVTGVASYVPEDVLTNKDLEAMVETNDEWIVSRTGIKQRHIQKEEGKGTSHMCAEAVKKLLAKTGTDPLDVDLIIIGTITGDFVFPSTANLVTEMTGCTNAWGFDLAGACSGFIYSMATAQQFVENGAYKKVIVVGSDKMSSIVDYEDRSTCILFGDAAAAVLLEPDTEGYGIQDHIMKSDGKGLDLLYQPAGGSRKPASHETVENKEHFLRQEGAAVFKFAVTRMADVAEEIMERNDLTGDDVAYLVPHQAINASLMRQHVEWKWTTAKSC